MSSFTHTDTLSSGNSPTLTITAPTGEAARIESITLGDMDEDECNIGITRSDVNDGSRTETDTIARGTGGEVTGPWVVDDTHGLLIEYTGSGSIVYSYRGVQL